MFSVSQLHLDRFKQNSQKVMLNNLATAVQNFVRKFWILMVLDIDMHKHSATRAVQCLWCLSAAQPHAPINWILMICINCQLFGTECHSFPCCVWKTETRWLWLSGSVYLAISRTDQCVLAENQLLNVWHVAGYAHCMLFPAALPPLHWTCGLDLPYP